MRKQLLGGVAVAAMIAAGFATPAAAADLGVAPVYKAPMAVPLPDNWTGFYLGGHIGGGWGTKELSFAQDPQNGPFAGKSISSPEVNGFLGGVQAGYNHQFGWVVLGVGGDFSWADIKGEAPALNIPACCSFTFAAKTNWLATLTGRIGGTVDHALLYVKGGAAWAHDKYSISDPGYAASVTGEETRSGWTVGGGVEYAFTRNWSGKLEYDFMDFGTKDVDFSYAGQTEFRGSIRQRIHVVKVGLNYRFDWGR